MTLEERFAAKVNKDGPDGCWLWMGGTDGIGAGKFWVNGRLEMAHRVSYELNVGPIPDGLFICHRCDNHSCVNPAHLFPGSHLDNMADMRHKDRSGHGSRNSSARLSEADVLAIRARHAAGERNFAAMGREYGVGPWTIADIVHLRRWKALDRDRYPKDGA